MFPSVKRMVMFAIGLLFACVCGSARADTLFLTSASNGTYTYGITITGTDSFATQANETSAYAIRLTGLFGVEIALPGQTPLTVTFTPTSVSLNNVGAFGPVVLGPGTIPDLFTVVSSSTTEGPASYNINPTPNGPFTRGSVEGPVAPVAATPEPSGTILLGTGLLCLGFSYRKLVPGGWRAHSS